MTTENMMDEYRRLIRSRVESSNNPATPAVRAGERKGKTMKTIKSGDKLTARSIGDWNCVYVAEILGRKGKFVTVKADGREKRVMVRTDHEGNEFIFALGQYSMAPVFKAA